MGSHDPLLQPEEMKRLITTTATKLPSNTARRNGFRLVAPRAAVQAAIESVRSEVPIDDLVEEMNTAEFPLLEFVMELQRRPTKTAGPESSRSEAVRSLILLMWRRRLSAERDTLGHDNPERRAQITYDLKSLQTWREGAAIIEIEMPGHGSTGE